MALLTDRKFIHFNKKEDFLVQLNANAIADWQIVFIGNGNSGEEAPEIWTHGTYYGSVEQFLDETNKDSTNAISAAAVYQALADDEEVIAAALNDLNDRIENLDIPSKISDLTDDLSLATQDYVDDKLDDVLGISAEGVEAFVNMTRDEDTATGILTEIVNKASKTNAVNGAPLSNTESYFYGTSTTAAATVQKEVSIPSITSLKTGQIIVVKPTITSTVANSTIKLNNFTAYPMRYNNAAITTSTDSIVWAANIPSIWVFDGTYWVFLGHGLDSNTTYSSMSQAEASAGTSTTARTISAKVLHDTIEESIPVPLIIEVNDTDTTVPSGTYTSIGTAIAAGRDVIIKVSGIPEIGATTYCRLTTNYTSVDNSYIFAELTDTSTQKYMVIINSDNSISQESVYFAQEQHDHGYIDHNGTLSIQTSDTAIANNDKIVIYDASNDGAIMRSTITFDGSTTTKALTPKGTWETFLQDHQSIKSLNTNNTSAQTVNASEAIAGSGTINLHKVSKTGSYSDLIKPSTGIPKTDLASAVQTSLGKADTSVQNKGSESNIVVGVGNNSNISVTSSNIGMETENGAISIGNDITLNTSGVVNYNGSRVATVTDLQGKQDVIRDLQTIRDGAADGATAIQGVKVNGTALTPDSNKAVDITAIPASIVTEDSTHKFATNAEKTKWNTLSNVIDVPEGPDLTVTSNTIMAVGVSSPGYGMESNAIYIKAPTGSSNANILKITGNGIQTAVLNSGSLSAWTSYGTSDLTPTTPISIVQGTGSSQNIKYIKLVGNKNTDIAQIIESPDTDGGWEHAGNSGIPTVALVASKVDVKYTKPSTGIPKTDLASAVQTSLGKADSAIQGVKVNGTALTPDSNKAVNITSIPASIVTQDATHRFVTDNEKNNWDNKLDTLYNNVTSAGSTYPVSGYAVTSYVDPLIEGKQDKFQYIQEDSTSDTTSVSIESDILIVPETIYTNDNFYQIATTNDIKVTSVKVNGTALTPDANKAVNITIPEGELSTNYEPSSLDNEDLELAAGDTYEEAFGKLEKSINDNEQITAAALTDLDSRINTLHLPQSLDDIPDGSTRKLSDYATTTQLATKQDALVSGTNIKTINNESILGSGNITIQGGSGGDTNVIETIKVNGTALTPDSNKAVDISTVTSFNGNTGAITYTAPVTSVNGQTGAVNLTIPSAVTESTVSGWGFTKNAGTLTGVTIGGNPATVSNGVASFPISYKAYDDSVYSFTNWIGRLFSVLTFSDVNNFINQFIFNGTIN